MSGPPIPITSCPDVRLWEPLQGIRSLSATYSGSVTQFSSSRIILGTVQRAYDPILTDLGRFPTLFDTLRTRTALHAGYHNPSPLYLEGNRRTQHHSGTSFPTVTRKSPTKYLKISQKKKAEKRIKDSLATLDGYKMDLMLCISSFLKEDPTDSPIDSVRIAILETLVQPTESKHIFGLLLRVY